MKIVNTTDCMKGFRAYFVFQVEETELKTESRLVVRLDWYTNDLPFVSSAFNC